MPRDNSWRILLILILIVGSIFCLMRYQLWWRPIINEHEAALKRIDLLTNWDDLKEAEIQFRTMVAQYENDKLQYETYKDTDVEKATIFKVRANRTATTYNQLYLKISGIYMSRVPSDILSELEVLQ